MGLTVHQALDKVIEAGGTTLAAKDIIGSGKKAPVDLLEEMCSNGLLEKTAGKSPKFTVTEKGLAEWEQEAPEERRQEIQHRKRERQRLAQQALDKAIEAGGTALAAEDIVGSGEGAAALLDEMCSNGLLEKTTGKSPKYTVAEKGRQVWMQGAPEERRREIQQREHDRQRQAMVGFLKLVKQKLGTALTKPELTNFPDAMRQEACDRKLVESGAKKNSYRVLPSGEEMIQADQPAAQQVEQLQQLSRDAVAKWRAIQQRLKEELGGTRSLVLQAAADQLAERGEAALLGFDKVLPELGGFATLLDAGRRLREEVEAVSKQARQVFEAEKDRLESLEGRLRQDVGEQHDQIEAFERRFDERLTALGHLATSQASIGEPTPRDKEEPAVSQPQPPTTPPAPPPEATV